MDFPDLSWAEAFTAAKLIGNGTGWHVGAMVGSPDFIGDIKEVKGKTDTGFVAPMAAGVAAAFESDQEGISRYCDMYRSRLKALIEIMTGQGMRLAIAAVGGIFHAVADSHPRLWPAGGILPGFQLPHDH